MLHDLGLQTLPPQSLDGGLVQQNEIHDFTQGRSTTSPSTSRTCAAVTASE